MMRHPIFTDAARGNELKNRFEFSFARRTFVAALLIVWGLLWCGFTSASAPLMASADEPVATEETVQDESDFVADEGDSTSDEDDLASDEGGDVPDVSESQALESAETPGATSVDTSEDNYVDPAQAADNSFIYDTSIASLAQEASFHDGQTVQVVGEVVGDCIGADTPGHYWITIEAEEKNDSSSISVYATETQVEIIDHYGRYGVVGTRVQVRGVYHQACDEHDGLADIHVTSLEVSRAGYETPDAFVMREFLPGFMLLAVGLALVVLFRIVRERSR